MHGDNPVKVKAVLQLASVSGIGTSKPNDSIFVCRLRDLQFPGCLQFYQCVGP